MLKPNNTPSKLTLKYPPALNQILYGPPGTGKTFFTRAMAVKVADAQWYEEQYEELPWSEFHEAVKERYTELVDEGRIDFVTFHQSFSYEEFVEGIRAKEDSGSLSYRVEPGVFKKMCRKAENRSVGATSAGISDQAKVWKVSIDGTGGSKARNHCFDQNEMRIGWGYVGDLSDSGRDPKQIEHFKNEGSNNQNTMLAFAEEAEIGDVILCIASNTSVKAVGVVTGDYVYKKTPAPGTKDYNHCRPVNWLVRDVNIPFNGPEWWQKFHFKNLL